MISRIRIVLQRYPPQFWWIAGVMMLAWMFHSMLWPYLIIYSSEKLAQPLMVVAGLLTINAAVGLVTTALGGAIADRFGRKWVMVIGFFFCAVSWYFFQLATTWGFFVGLMALNGATTPLYRLASDSMMADLVPGEKRIEAYSILRMGSNIGVALGPAIGGYTAAFSYSLSFTITGLGLFACGVIAMFCFRETIPKHSLVVQQDDGSLKGYWHLLHDGQFLILIGAYTLNRISSSTIWLMLAVYVKNYFGINENLYWFIPTTNALMVIFFQVLVTNWVKRHDDKWMLVLGSAIYGVALLGVVLGTGFWAFWLCMVIATIGEMILVPTSTTTAAAMAPESMRARYMGLYTLTSGIGSGVGPLMGGMLSDAYGPLAIWYGGGLVGFAGAAVFLGNLLVQKRKSARLIES